MSTLASRNRQVTTVGGKKQLTNPIGEVVLEQAISTDDLLYVKNPGTFVSKAQLEELLEVKILKYGEMPKIGPADSSKAANEFKVGGVAHYSYKENAEDLRKFALRTLAAANEIDRYNTEKAAEKEKARLKALEENGKKRREIGVLRDLLEEEGMPWPQSTAEALYEAGVRKV